MKKLFILFLVGGLLIATAVYAAENKVPITPEILTQLQGNWDGWRLFKGASEPRGSALEIKVSNGRLSGAITNYGRLPSSKTYPFEHGSGIEDGKLVLKQDQGQVVLTLYDVGKKWELRGEFNYSSQSGEMFFTKKK